MKKAISTILTAVMLGGSFAFVPAGLLDRDITNGFSAGDMFRKLIKYDETASEITYVDGNIYIDGVQTNSFPKSGNYYLGSDVTTSSNINIASGTTLQLDLNGYNLYDTNTSGTAYITVLGTFDLSDSVGTGSIDGTGASNHIAVIIKGGGTMNMTAGQIANFTAKKEGVGVYMENNSIFNMSGGKIYNCSSSYNSGGGGVYVHGGKFYMNGTASIDSCKTTAIGANRYKTGNGAGLEISHGGEVHMSGNASIVNCTATGYHGAGVDMWGLNSSGAGYFYLSGSPTIANNYNGNNEPCNLYGGTPVIIEGELTGSAGSIGITVQDDPVFTVDLLEKNPGRSIDDLCAIFSSDRQSWSTSLPDTYGQYTIEPTSDGMEAMQTPCYEVHFYTTDDPEAAPYVTQLVVPGGCARKFNNPPAQNGAKFLDWYAEGSSSAWKFADTKVYANTEIFAKYAYNFKGFSLAFDKTAIRIRCYIPNGPQLNNKKASVTGYLDGSTPSVQYKNNKLATVDGVECAYFDFNVSAYEMTKPLEFKFDYGNNNTVTTTTTVKQILSAIIDPDSSYTSSQKQLAAKTLYFGAAVSKQLGYYVDDDEYASDNVTGIETYANGSAPSLSVAAQTKTGFEGTTVTFYAASFVYREKLNIKFYYKLNGESMDDYSVSVDGGSYTALTGLDDSGKYMYVTVGVNINALDSVHTVILKNNSTGEEIGTVTYSAYNYISNMITKKSPSDPVYETVVSLYYLCETAKAY